MLGYIGDIEHATKENDTFRTVVFTGEHSQLTVMCIPQGEDIGLELHADHDQFLRIEQGHGRVQLGPERDRLDEVQDVDENWAVLIPAGVWHNVVNTGEGDLKLYSVYAPSVHPADAVHRTKADAEEAERAYHAV